MLSFDRAMRATRGAREYQEDTALLWPGDDPSAPVASATNADSMVLALLADGMGGHVGGALASRLVCERFLSFYLEHPTSAMTASLLDALAAANTAIAERVADNPLLTGMGTTLIGAAFRDDGVSWVSVGDSPMMLWRRGEIALLNEDHSLAPDIDRLAAAGKLSAEQARRDPRRHMLRSAITGEDIDLVDISKCPLQLAPDDYVILASDGIQSIEPAEISRIISAYGADGAEAVAGALVRTIDGLREPHQDNATIIAVRVQTA